MSTPSTLPPVFESAPGAPDEPGPRPYRPRSSKNAWMVTFADLIALMLTFFVLLFAMSQMQREKWQSLVESLASNLSSTYEIETAKFTTDYQPEAQSAPPGADLDYLEPILREHFAAELLLAGGVIERVDGGLGVLFPDERLFVGRTSKLTTRGEKIVFALGGVLRNLDNAIDVNTRVSRAGAAGSAADWETALARSMAVVRILAQSGFAGPIVARSQGIGTIRADGLGIVVRENRR
jgi:chemotaxis protein MotB